jgi:L-asparaginase/Glu-tRNA(Gln) amidotransferase subunit D
MDAPTTGKWCGINSGVTKMRMYTVSASSAITYKCLKLFKNGSVENVEMATNNTGQWFTLTTSFTNVVCVIVYYSGTLASGQELRVYFE